jgi:hypothetical protein
MAKAARASPHFATRRLGAASVSAPPDCKSMPASCHCDLLIGCTLDASGLWLPLHFACASWVSRWTRSPQPLRGRLPNPRQPQPTNKERNQSVSQRRTEAPKGRKPQQEGARGAKRKRKSTEQQNTDRTSRLPNQKTDCRRRWLLPKLSWCCGKKQPKNRLKNGRFFGGNTFT